MEKKNILIGIILLVLCTIFGLYIFHIDFFQIVSSNQNEKSTCTLVPIFYGQQIVNESQNNSTICIKLNETFQIKLHEIVPLNALWQFNLSEGLKITNSSRSFVYPNGTPGVATRYEDQFHIIHTWEITAIDTGKQEIKGNDGDGWDKFYLTIIVR